MGSCCLDRARRRAPHEGSAPNYKLASSPAATSRGRNPVPYRAWERGGRCELGLRGAGFFAQAEAREASHHDVLLDDGDLLLDDLADRLLRLANVGLFQEAERRVVLLELAFRDLLDDVRGLAGGRRLR